MTKNTKNTWAAIALGAALFAVPFAAFAADSDQADASTGSDFDVHVSWMESSWDAMSAAMEGGDWAAMHALMESAPGMEMGSMMGDMGSTGMGDLDSTNGDDHDSHHGSSGGMGDMGSTSMGGMNW